MRAPHPGGRVEAGPPGRRALAPTVAPPDCPPIPESALRPGDVLLSYGSDTDLIDVVIRTLDDGIYSHAAVWDGECVVEATLRGVRRSSLKEEQEQSYIDVYRWRPTPPTAHVLGDAAYPYQPVTAEADKIADARLDYSYSKMVLAGLVIGISKVPLDAEMRGRVRYVANALADWVLSLKKKGKGSMTCTEVVATTFWDASDDRKYAIDIIVDGSRDSDAIRAVAQSPRGPGAKPPVSDDELKQTCLELFLETAPGVGREALLAWADAQSHALRFGTPLPTGGRPSVPLACVTPRDLQRSPDLKCVGRLPTR